MERNQTFALRGDDILFIPGSTGKKAPCVPSRQLFKREQAWQSGARLEAFSEAWYETL